MLALRCFLDIKVVMSGRILTTVQSLGRDLNNMYERKSPQ